MRLIDADGVIEEIKKNKLLAREPATERGMEIIKNATTYVEPTTYDVDKVVEQMSRVLPILFNTDMVRAILEGRKTVTRRLMKPNPPCQPGDVLYVRETYCPNYFDTSIAVGCKYKSRHAYKVDYCKESIGDIVPEPKWTPSIYMPKRAARIWLKVTDVRVERLQDITAEQIIKEGANQENIKHYIAQMPKETEEWIEVAHKLEWQQLWDFTVRKPYLDLYGWEANPWVWVIEFERCEKPEGI